MLMDVVGNLGDICIIQRGVDLVEDEEWRGLVAVDGEEEGECGHCFFAAGEVFHVAEAFEGGHGVVFDAVEVGLVAVFHVEVAGWLLVIKELMCGIWYERLTAHG